MLTLDSSSLGDGIICESCFFLIPPSFSKMSLYSFCSQERHKFFNLKIILWMNCYGKSMDGLPGLRKAKKAQNTIIHNACKMLT